MEKVEKKVHEVALQAIHQFQYQEKYFGERCTLSSVIITSLRSPKGNVSVNVSCFPNTETKYLLNALDRSFSEVKAVSSNNKLID